MKTFIALFALVALISAVRREKWNFVQNCWLQSLFQTAVDEKAAKAAEKAAFLGKLAAECSQEVGFDIGAASKLLHGDFSDRSEQAKVEFRMIFVWNFLINFS